MADHDGRCLRKQGDLCERLKTDAPSSWPLLWGEIVAHRSACLRAVGTAMDELLHDPVMTRGRFKKRVQEVLREIADHGP